MRVGFAILAGAALGSAALSGCASGSHGSASDDAAALAVAPDTVTILQGDRVSFHAVVTGAAGSTVVWSVEEAVGGSIDGAGTYTAPLTAGVFHVRAEVAGRPGVYGRATVTVVPGFGEKLAIRPRSVLVEAGASEQFYVTATGVSGGVTWRVVEPSGCGTIDATGLYTAPAAPALCHLSVQSTAQAQVTDTVPVIVRAVGARLLGANIFSTNDWDPTQIFADAMKHARHFGSAGAPYDEAAPVDALGWPTGDAGVVVQTGIPAMSGTYGLSFTGQATAAVNSNDDPGTTVRNARYDAANNRTTAEVVVGPSESNLFLTFRGQAGGVKNVRLLRPGHGPDEIFNQQFLARLSRFQVLRFMDYSSTNWNAQAQWADRLLPGNASQQHRPDDVDVGSSWEYVVLLANLTGKDVWINVPHLASDDYVTKLAQLFRYGSDGVNPYTSERANPLYPPLDPGRRVYVEYSNELWNGGFGQSAWLEGQAQAALAAGDADLTYDGNRNLYAVMFRMVGRRTAQVSNLFRSVFGDAQMMTRVRPVLPGQVANFGTISYPLDYLRNRWAGGAARYVYAITGAPYFRDNGSDTRTDLTLDMAYAEMTTYIATDIPSWLTDWAAAARTHGVKLVAYEGGQHLVGTGSIDVKRAAQMDARMRVLTGNLFREWFTRGGDVFMYYTLCSGWGQYGFWGLSDDISSEVGPKWDAIRDSFQDP